MAYYMDVTVSLNGGEDTDESRQFLANPYYEAIREALDPAYHDLSRREIDDLLADVVENMSLGEVQGLENTLGNLVKAIVPVAAQLLPVAAPLIGTIIGGPAGGAIGSTIGKVAGQVLGGVSGPPSAGPAAPIAAPAGAQAPVPAGGSSATAQLMALVSNPVFLRTLLGGALGQAGRASVPVGPQDTPVPFGAFMNALAALAHQAAGEANVRIAQESAEDIPEYLLDHQGNPQCDLAVPEGRAQRLLALLHEDTLAGAEDGEEDALTEWLVEANLVQAPDPRYARRRPRTLYRHPRRRPGERRVVGEKQRGR